MEEEKFLISTKVDDIIKEYYGEENAVITIFGGGQLAEQFIYNTQIRIFPYIYDNDIKKQGMKINNCIVRYAADIKSDVPRYQWILIASNYDEEIARQLLAEGYKNILSLRMLQKRVIIENSISKRKIEACMLEATNCCNARCEFCANPVMHRKKMHMPQAVFDKTLERLLEEQISPEKFRLHFAGEPLLDPALFEKIKYLKELFPNSQVGYTTNFSIADAAVINKIIESGQDYITISLNAIEESEYQNIMGLDYQRTISNIEAFLLKRDMEKIDMKVTLSAVANETEDTAEFQKYWADRNVEVRVMRKGKWVGKNTLKDSKGNQSNKIYKVHTCGFLYNQICILSNGSYGICCFDAEGNMGGMNIWNTGIMESFNSTIKREMRKQIYEGSGLPIFCRECSFT